MHGNVDNPTKRQLEGQGALNHVVPGGEDGYSKDTFKFRDLWSVWYLVGLWLVSSPYMFVIGNDHVICHTGAYDVQIVLVRLLASE